MLFKFLNKSKSKGQPTVKNDSFRLIFQDERHQSDTFLEKLKQEETIQDLSKQLIEHSKSTNCRNLSEHYSPGTVYPFAISWVSGFKLIPLLSNVAIGCEIALSIYATDDANQPYHWGVFTYIDGAVTDLPFTRPVDPTYAKEMVEFYIQTIQNLLPFIKAYCESSCDPDKGYSQEIKEMAAQLGLTLPVPFQEQFMLRS